MDETVSLISSRALIIAQISAVNMDAEPSNVMEITVCDGNTVAQATELHPVIRLYRQECNHGTCLEFPWLIAYKQMHLGDLSS